MNILIACEESQRVCIEFRKKGHNAFSCDLLPSSGGHPEWHIKHDVMDLLKTPTYFFTENGLYYTMQKWDMVIAFPPCTHLAVSGAAWFEQKRKDGRQEEAIEFFCKFLTIDCEKVVIENPIGIISGNYIKEYFPKYAEKYNLPRKPTQIIQPWNFGDNYAKKTCLWLKGLEPLTLEVTEAPKLDYLEFVNKKTGKKTRMTKWYSDAWRLNQEERAKVRSKTFPGIARAMAEQWG